MPGKLLGVLAIFQGRTVENSETESAKVPAADARPAVFAAVIPPVISMMLAIMLALPIYAIAAKTGGLTSIAGSRNGSSAFVISYIVIYLLTKLYIALRYDLRTAFVIRQFKATEAYLSLGTTREQMMDRISIPLYWLLVVALFTAYFLISNNQWLGRTAMAGMCSLFLSWLLLRLYVRVRYGKEAMRSLGWFDS